MFFAMTIFVDTKYIHQISFRLKNFKQKSNRLWNFSCPICGDSKKSRTKARGYIYEANQHLNFKCHNCSVSISFANFLKSVDISLHKEYIAEKFFNGNGRTIEKPKEEIPVGRKPVKSPEIKIDLPSLLTLSAIHEARNYVDERKIPKQKYHNLYYCKNFVEWANSIIPGIMAKDIPEHSRLIIPFKTKHGKIFAVQGRALSKKILPKYFTLKLDKDQPLIFGLDTCKFDESYYVVEGPIDSLFLENSIAVAGLKLPVLLSELDKSNATIVFDNEPRNIHLVKKIEKAIESHFKICLLPKTFKKLKDINDYIKSGMSIDDVVSMLQCNTSRDLQAHLMLSQWRKAK